MDDTPHHSNPVDWHPPMPTEAELIAVLDLARQTGLWIVADEIYGRLTYRGRRAPSFQLVMIPFRSLLKIASSADSTIAARRARAISICF